MENKTNKHSNENTSNKNQLVIDVSGLSEFEISVIKKYVKLLKKNKARSIPTI